MLNFVSNTPVEATSIAISWKTSASPSAPKLGPKNPFQIATRIRKKNPIKINFIYMITLLITFMKVT